MKKWALIDAGMIITCTESADMPAVFGPWVEWPDGYVWTSGGFVPDESPKHAG